MSYSRSDIEAQKDKLKNAMLELRKELKLEDGKHSIASATGQAADSIIKKMLSDFPKDPKKKIAEQLATLSHIYIFIHQFLANNPPSDLDKIKMDFVLTKLKSFENSQQIRTSHDSFDRLKNVANPDYPKQEILNLTHQIAEAEKKLRKDIKTYQLSSFYCDFVHLTNLDPEGKVEAAIKKTNDNLIKEEERRKTPIEDLQQLQNLKNQLQQYKALDKALANQLQIKSDEAKHSKKAPSSTELKKILNEESELQSTIDTLIKQLKQYKEYKYATIAVNKEPLQTAIAALNIDERLKSLNELNHNIELKKAIHDKNPANVIRILKALDFNTALGSCDDNFFLNTQEKLEALQEKLKPVEAAKNAYENAVSQRKKELENLDNKDKEELAKELELPHQTIGNFIKRRIERYPAEIKDSSGFTDNLNKLINTDKADDLKIADLLLANINDKNSHIYKAIEALTLIKALQVNFPRSSFSICKATTAVTNKNFLSMRLKTIKYLVKTQLEKLEKMEHDKQQLDALHKASSNPMDQIQDFFKYIIKDAELDLTSELDAIKQSDKKTLENNIKVLKDKIQLLSFEHSKTANDAIDAMNAIRTLEIDYPNASYSTNEAKYSDGNSFDKTAQARLKCLSEEVQHRYSKERFSAKLNELYQESKKPAQQIQSFLTILLPLPLRNELQTIIDSKDEKILTSKIASLKEKIIAQIDPEAISTILAALEAINTITLLRIRFPESKFSIHQENMGNKKLFDLAIYRLKDIDARAKQEMNKNQTEKIKKDLPNIQKNNLEITTEDLPSRIKGIKKYLRCLILIEQFDKNNDQRKNFSALLEAIDNQNIANIETYIKTADNNLIYKQINIGIITLVNLIKINNYFTKNKINNNVFIPGFNPANETLDDWFKNLNTWADKKRNYHIYKAYEADKPSANIGQNAGSFASGLGSTGAIAAAVTLGVLAATNLWNPLGWAAIAALAVCSTGLAYTSYNLSPNKWGSGAGASGTVATASVAVGVLSAVGVVNAWNPLGWAILGGLALVASVGCAYKSYKQYQKDKKAAVKQANAKVNTDEQPPQAGPELPSAESPSSVAAVVNRMPGVENGLKPSPRVQVLEQKEQPAVIISHQNSENSNSAALSPRYSLMDY